MPMHSFLYCKDTRQAVRISASAERCSTVQLLVIADGGTRAVMSCLRKHANAIEVPDIEVSGQIEASVYELPAPFLPESMKLTRKDMLHCLRRNFDLGTQQIENAPEHKRESVQQATVTRCAPQFRDIASIRLHHAPPVSKRSSMMLWPSCIKCFCVDISPLPESKISCRGIVLGDFLHWQVRSLRYRKAS